jgi:hypothetical protein
MHESDAFEFVDIVLSGFIERNYRPLLDVDDEYEPLKQDVRDFLADETPYWVKEKALGIIMSIQGAEDRCKKGDYKPDTPTKATREILRSAYKDIKWIYSDCHDEKRRRVIRAPFPLPKFPRKYH